MNSLRIDAQAVKEAARGGKAVELLEYVAGLPRDILDGKHHPCPRCGGKNRFRLIDQEAGAVLCNQCFAKDNGDFLAATMHYRGIGFPQALQESAYRLGLVNTPVVGGNGSNGKKTGATQGAATAADQTSVDPIDRMAAVKHCPAASLRAYGAKSSPAHGVLAIPMFRQDAEMCSQCNYWPDSPDEQRRKGLNAKGKDAGVFLPVNVEKEEARKPQAGETWLLIEGKDAFALHGLGYLAMGLATNQLNPKFAPLLRGVHVVVIPHPDEGGDKGLPTTLKALDGVAASVRVANLPHRGKDVRDHLALDGGEQLVRQIIDGAAAGGTPGTQEDAFPPVVTFRELSEQFPEQEPEVIHGVARACEIVSIVSSTKRGKSWSIADLALAGVTGLKWMDSFDVEAGEVLVLDNELQPGTLRYRIRTVADKRDLDFDRYADRLHVVPFRGRLRPLYALGPFFAQFEPGQFKLILIDALYRFLGDVEENSNSEMTGIYNELDKHAARLRCAIAVVHHASKGNQSGKQITDVGSGAGAQSRAVDTHLILRPHAEPDCAVLEAVCRSFPPIEPRVLRWAWPVWNLAPELDPAALQKAKAAQVGEAQNAAVQEMRKSILDTFNHFPGGATKTKIRDRVGQGKIFNAAWLAVCNSGELIEAEVMQKNGRTYPGFKRVYRDDKAATKNDGDESKKQQQLLPE